MLHTKSIKSIKSTKSIKKHKKHKKHKDANKRISDFLPLRCFYAYKNAAFFVFSRLYAFCAFCACEICKKINKFESTLISLFILLL